MIPYMLFTVKILIQLKQLSFNFNPIGSLFAWQLTHPLLKFRFEIDVQKNYKEEWQEIVPLPDNLRKVIFIFDVK